jgi:hypothetical protein
MLILWIFNSKFPYKSMHANRHVLISFKESTIFSDVILSLNVAMSSTQKLCKNGCTN